MKTKMKMKIYIGNRKTRQRRPAHFSKSLRFREKNISPFLPDSIQVRIPVLYLPSSPPIFTSF